jgi:hypothetical protein
VLRPEWVLPQRSRDAGRIYLPAPAAVVSFLDATHLVASLPALAAVTVVTVGDEPSVAEPTVLDPFPLLDPEGRPQDGLPTPWSVLVDPGRTRVLVGDRNAGRLAMLAWDDDFVLRVTGLAQVSGPVRAMDIEPPRDGGLPGRWIYAADGRSGGVMVPLTSRHTVRDWIAALDVPLLLVCGTYLGALSHTLTALAALRELNIRPAHLILNESFGSAVSIEDTLASLTPHAGGLPIVVLRRDDSSGLKRLADLLL